MGHKESPRVPVSWGELLDKITILEIKRDRIANADALANIGKEHELLLSVGNKTLKDQAVLPLFDELRRVNEALWEIEDAIREQEARRDFGMTFIDLARSVYKLNDRRAVIKRQMNSLLNSELTEEKSYTDFVTQDAASLPVTRTIAQSGAHPVADVEPGTGKHGYKVAVLTFHKCINYGSYWQARCLVEGLRGMGADVVLLDHESASIKREEWRCALRPTLPEPTLRSDFPAYAEKTRKFLTAFESMPRSSPFPLEQPDQLADYDAIVIGSDEVWNLRHPWYGGYSIFYGTGLPCKNIVSYAASFGSQDAADGLSGHWADQLGNFAALSVRDENSRRIVKAAVGHDPELVLDPCLQFPPKLADGVHREEGEPYVALYGHGFPAWFSKAVRQEATRNGQKIISIGYRNHWADEQRLTAGPEEFAQLIAGSSAVVTNFFHGCVFALVNGLPLVTAPSAYRFNKVRDLLNSLDAERHMVTESSSTQVYERLMVEPPETVVAERIASLRRGSDDYLRRSLAFQR
jgi:hypothetical protein